MTTMLDDSNLYLIIVTIYEILLIGVFFYDRVLNRKASWNLKSFMEYREAIYYLYCPLILLSLVIWGVSRIVYFDLRIPYTVICFLQFVFWGILWLCAPYGGKYNYVYPLVNLVLFFVMVCLFYIREIINIIQKLLDFIK